MKMTKSWKLTLISFIVVMAMPVVNGPLGEFGIVITEQELQHFLFVFFGVSAAGGGMSAYKKRVENKKPNVVVERQPQKSDVNNNAWEKAFEESAVERVPEKTITVKAPTHSVTIPDESPTETVTIPISDLEPSETVTIPDPEQVKATSIPELGPIDSIYQTNFRKDPQIGNVLAYGEPYLFARRVGARSYVTGILRDLSGKIIQIRQSVPGGEIIRFVLKNRQGSFERGKYSLQVQTDSGTSDSQGNKNDEFQIV